MNFYKHYIGDFQRDTSHLSLTERGAYLALIHHYYATEKPLPNDYAALCRVAGAFTKTERDAVKTAMGFFTLVNSGLMHNRIEAELHKAGEISTTNRDIALAREAKRRAEKEAQTEHEPSTNRAQSVARTEHEQSTPRHQTPDTIRDKEEPPPISTPQGSGAVDAEIPKTTPAGEICKALKSAGLQSVSPNHPELLALIAKGVTREQFIEAAQAANGKRSPFAYMLSVVKSQLAAANDIEKAPGMPDTAWDLHGGTIRAKAKEVGFEPWAGDGPSTTKQPEPFSTYTERLRAFIETKKGQS
jgi:uncharacterized protein YdaU (DUF1376 family)